METRQLNADKIVDTVEALSHRVDERFPDSGLGKVCLRLLDVARRAKACAESISRPSLPLRAITAVVVFSILAALTITLWYLPVRAEDLDFAELIQTIDAGINDLIFVGAALFFLMTLETRLKRARALKALHELRVIAHIIDMHQLTKDPERLLHPQHDTPSSPRARQMTAFELNRYLDYCSEMLSLTGKLAVLYVQHFNDPSAVTAVNEIESLTNGLARKIWQKITILESFQGQGRSAQPAPAA